jgi:deazaflavin-dependent oxidoreductase (nitroreductase family)
MKERELSTDPVIQAQAIRGWSAEHRDRYLATDGEDGDTIDGFPALILTTTGRRSGEPRSTPLIFGETEGCHVIVASFAGLPEHPAWYLNLVSDPVVGVQVRGDRFTGHARTTTGSERDRCWRLMAAIFPMYEQYAAKAEREIPVVAIERR